MRCSCAVHRLCKQTCASFVTHVDSSAHTEFTAKGAQPNILVVCHVRHRARVLPSARGGGDCLPGGHQEGVPQASLGAWGEGVGGSMDDAAVVGRVAEVALCCWLDTALQGRRWHACNFWLLAPVTSPPLSLLARHPCRSGILTRTLGMKRPRSCSRRYQRRTLVRVFLFLFLRE
jgi:hypothetical protein